MTSPITLGGKALTVNSALATGATGPTQTTFSGGITNLANSGAFALENTGGGNLTVSSASQSLAGNTTLDSESGSTITLSGGTLALGSYTLGTTGGSGAINVSDNISGAGGVTVNGTGTLTLSGSDSYNGPTSITNGMLAGHLQRRASANTAVTVAGGSLGLGGGVTTSLGLSISGTGGGLGAIDSLSGTNTVNGQITLNANATIDAASGSTLVLNGQINLGGHTLTIAGTGTVNLSIADFGLVGNGLTVNAGANLAFAVPAGGYTLTGNFTPNLPSGSYIITGGPIHTAGYELGLSGAGSLTVTDAIDGVQNGANPDAIVDNSTGVLTLSGAITLAGDTTLYSGAGATLNIAGGSVNIGSYNLTSDGPGATNLGNVYYTFSYSDTAGDVAYGQLLTTSSGLSDGSVWATSGTLVVTASADNNIAVGTYVLGPAGPAQTHGTWDTQDFYVENLVYPNDNAAGSVVAAPGSNPAYLNEDGLIFLPASNTSGQPELSIWGNGGNGYAFYYATGSAYPADFPIQASTAWPFVMTSVPASETITGTTGSLTKNGTGTLTIGGTASYSGATAVNNGVLNLASAGALSSTSTPITVASGGTLMISAAVSSSATVQIAGAGYNGLGAIDNAAGSNSFSGAITLTADATINSSAGSLTLSGSGTGIDLKGHTLTVGGAANTTIGDQIWSSQVGDSLVKAGAGTLMLSAVNSYDGTTTVNAGYLEPMVTGALTTGGLTVNMGGALLMPGGVDASGGHDHQRHRPDRRRGHRAYHYFRVGHCRPRGRLLGRRPEQRPEPRQRRGDHRLADRHRSYALRRRTV